MKCIVTDTISFLSNTFPKIYSSLYLNYLKPGVLVEESGIFTVLRANEFYKWIGMKTLSKWSFWKN